jgi:protocatechuate 4,5-dioxygenase alpha chain
MPSTQFEIVWAAPTRPRKGGNGVTNSNKGMTPPDTFVFEGARSRQGYRLNRLCQSMTDPANRAAFLADEDGYMTRYGLSDDEKRWVRERDWLSMTRNGGNIYVMVKLAGAVGQNLLDVGAQMRGETLQQFIDSRPGRDKMGGGH